MNLPTVQEKTAFSKLPDNLKYYTEARLEKSVKAIFDIELKNKCLDLVSISYTEQAQFNIEHQILTHQAKALYDELRTNSKFKELTWSEVKNAFKLGVRGDSGPFFGMCAKTYHQFLKHYYEKPERVQGLKQYLELMETTTKVELTPDEKRQKSKESVNYFFNEYKETGKILTGYYQIYGFLMDEGLIKWTKEEKADIRNPIEKEYVKSLEKAVKRRTIKETDLKTILSNLNTTPTFVGMLRKEGLKRYFNRLIEGGNNFVFEV